MVYYIILDDAIRNLLFFGKKDKVMLYNTISNNPYGRTKIVNPWCYWDDAFNPLEIDTIVKYCEEQGTHMGTTFGSETEEQIKNVRVSNVKFHDKNEKTAWIFDKLNYIIKSINDEYYGFDLNGYSKFQYTTYNDSENGRYDWHMDTEINSRPHNQEDIEIRKLSMTLCLNENYEGGYFQINVGKESEPLFIQAKKGRAIFFPSFMIHRVTPVTLGTRRSLVVWVLGPKFK